MSVNALTSQCTASASRGLRPLSRRAPIRRVSKLVNGHLPPGYVDGMKQSVRANDVFATSAHWCADHVEVKPDKLLRRYAVDTTSKHRKS
jgi:hypothetical protein